MLNPRGLALLALCSCLSPALAPAADRQIERLQHSALQDGYAEALVTRLVTEVGPRFSGSDGYERAVLWALRSLDQAGLKQVRAEPVIQPRWVRGETRVEIVDGAEPQALSAVALGGSVGTDLRGIEAEVVRVSSLEELRALKPEQLRGRIAYIDFPMRRSQDASGYREAYALRSEGPAEAGRRGAAALLIRSLSTAQDDVPHTGSLDYADAPRIPALALSNLAADRLSARVQAGGAQLFIQLNTRELGAVNSAYVIGEVPGKSPEIVLLGAHLDSWDITPGAEDDGAGVAIVVAALRNIIKSGRKPQRTIRVVLYANEEFGLSGAKAYASAHAAELGQHVLAMEADLGSGRVWKLNVGLGEGGEALRDAAFSAVAPLGVTAGESSERGGADIAPLISGGVPMFSPRQDASRYFDVHHAASDTLDHLDREGLRQNVAVYSSLAWLAANWPGPIARLPVKTP